MLLPLLRDNKWPSSGSSHSHRTLWQRKRLHNKLWWPGEASFQAPQQPGRRNLPPTCRLPASGVFPKRAGMISRIAPAEEAAGRRRGVVLEIGLSLETT